MLGLLTAAGGGPLADADLTTLTGSPPWKVRLVLDGEAARTLQQTVPRMRRATPSPTRRCSPAASNKASVTAMPAESMTGRRPGGTAAGRSRDGEPGTPLYLLDRYPRALHADPPRLAALVGDVGWVTTAITTLGPDAVLAELKTADAAAPGEPRLAAMHAVLRGQVHHLRAPEAAADPAFAARQLCLQATELGEHDGGVVAAAVLPDGRVVTGGSNDGRVLLWDPAEPGAGPVQLGRHENGVRALAVLPDGRLGSTH